jgi:glycosyltransferase involved in cell wall biosynthesis
MTQKRLLVAATIPTTLRSFLLPFVRHFRTQGWRVDGMAAGISGCPTCRGAFDRVWDVGWSRNPTDINNFVGAPETVRDVVAIGNYDLVHVHTPVAAFVVRYALRRRGSTRPKVVYTAHGFHFHPGGTRLRNAVYIGLERLAGRWTDRLVVINKADRRACERHQISRDVVEMPGIGVDTVAYAPSSVTSRDIEAVRGELKLRPSDVLFTCVAYFDRDKRHVDAVSALARIGRRDAHLAFAGIGPELEPTRALASRLGVGPQVHFIGYRSDVPTLIRSSRAMVLPSVREGLPRAIMEAMALSVPVVGADIRGTRDLVSWGGGILVPPRDVDRLADALNWLCDHPNEARMMGRLGRARIADYDVERVIGMHEALYDEVCPAA